MKQFFKQLSKLLSHIFSIWIKQDYWPIIEKFSLPQNLNLRKSIVNNSLIEKKTEPL